MADHDGDYSPEREHQRQLKREKMQRRRIRQRIDEGYASALEHKAMELWESGQHEWEEIAQALKAEKENYSAQVPRETRSPRATRAATDEETPEGSGGWTPLLLAGGIVAGIIGGAIWLGRNVNPL